MFVDSRLFMSQPDAFEVEMGTSLAEILSESANGANGITVLSAYFGTLYLSELFGSVPKPKRKATNLTLVFGLDARNRLSSSLEELRKLELELKRLGYVDPDIRLICDSTPFHTKLYYFKRGTQHIWFIGSANASSAITGDRHELMMRLRGKHEALSQYVEAAVAKSVPIKAQISNGQPITDLKSFFLHGSVCYSPGTRLVLTFEAFNIEQKHKIALQRSLGELSKVPYADPKTEGFGFSLSSAVDAILKNKNDRIDHYMGEELDAFSVKYRHYAIETSYGYWMPVEYSTAVSKKLDEAVRADERKMEILRMKLENVSDGDLVAELDDHIAGMKAFFSTYELDIKIKEGCKNRFQKYVANRRSIIGNKSAVSSYIRRLHIESMPYIWDDPAASLSFEESFFGNLALRMEASARSKIVRVLMKECGLTDAADPQELRRRLESRLKLGIKGSIWGVNSEDDEEDDDE